jgi:hypothetical protein
MNLDTTVTMQKSFIEVNGVPMRFDVRTFAYGREPFMRMARVYRGQTTNFRTPGGGFAPVRVASAATAGNPVLDLAQG